MLRKSVCVILTAVVLLILVGFSAGCSSSQSQNKVAEMMNNFPGTESNFGFININNLRVDKDLQSLYSNLSSQISQLSNTTGINFGNISYFAATSSAVMIEGDFSVNDVRNNFTQQNLTSSKYQDIEIWSVSGSGIAFMSDKSILFSSDADVKTCIDVIKGKQSSLAADADIKAVLARLNNGFLSQFSKGTQFTLDSKDYNGLQAVGYSANKKDAVSVQVTTIMKFDSKVSADNVKLNIVDDFKNDTSNSWQNVNVTQDNNFLKITAEDTIADMLRQG